MGSFMYIRFEKTDVLLNPTAAPGGVARKDWAHCKIFPGKKKLMTVNDGYRTEQSFSHLFKFFRI